MSGRVLDATQYDGHLSGSDGFVKADVGRAALVDLDVILLGLHCRTGGGFFERCAHYGVPVVHCDWKGAPLSVTLPWSTNTRVARRHRLQADMSVPRAKHAWMRIVRAKIFGQAHVLDVVGSGGRALRLMATDVRSGDPSNVEGRAAAAYWHQMFNDPQFRRRARSGEQVNSLLDYGYAVLRGVCARYVVASGLWPTLGIYHHRRDNAFGLVDDLIEVFRPAVDVAVRRLVGEGCELGAEVKRTLVGVLVEPFDDTGVSLALTVERFAQHIAQYVEHEVDVLRPPVYSA